jgi:dsDNA-specific endonuclease/ATPase MutS2
LAHRYRLCLFYEGCLSENVRIANRRRDLEAAHSGITEFNPTTASKARDQLRIDTNKILTDLVHMLEHLGDIEEKMLLELQMMITDATDVCPVVNAFKETLPANAA